MTGEPGVTGAPGEPGVVGVPSLPGVVGGTGHRVPGPGAGYQSFAEPTLSSLTWNCDWCR